MKSKNTVSDEELSEYIDGGLTETRRAEIEAWLRENPAKAAEVERLRDLNRALRGLGSDILDEPVPERLQEALRTRRVERPERSDPSRTNASVRNRSGGRGSGASARGGLVPRRALSLVEAAAALVILVLGGALGWGAHSMLSERPSDAELALAAAGMAYAVYASDPEFPVEFPPEREADFEAFVSRVFERTIPRPDLTQAGYDYRGARLVPIGPRASVFLLFESVENADQVTVAFWPAENAASSQIEALPAGNVASHYWAAGGLGFAVLGAKGNTRLEAIADEVFSFYDAKRQSWAEPTPVTADRS